MYDRACMRLSPEESRARVANGEQHTVRLKVRARGRRDERLRHHSRRLRSALAHTPEQVPAGTTLLDDLVRGKVSFTNSTIDDQVCLPRSLPAICCARPADCAPRRSCSSLMASPPTISPT